MKANEVMRIGRKRTRAASVAAGSGPRRALVLPRELHDQNRVLGGQADQHDEADLGENVHVHAAQK
jgi:hypothetical protein